MHECNVVVRLGRLINFLQKKKKKHNNILCDI
jgi:hypothetical protein